MTTSLAQTNALPGTRLPPWLAWPLATWQLFTDPIGAIGRLRHHGDVVLLARGGPGLFFSLERSPATVFVFGAAQNHLVMANPDLFHSAPVIGMLYPPEGATGRRAVLRQLGAGLFGVQGAEHRRQRRLAMPAFHRQRIAGYYADMVRLTQAQLDGWRPGERRDILQEMMELTLRIAGRSFFGLDFGGAARPLGLLMQRWLQQSTAAGVTLLQLDLPGTPYARFLDLSVRLDAELRAIVRRIMAGGGGDDLISLLAQARDEETGSALSEDELVGHASVFFLAGHETSSNALTWTLFLLSQHPQVAEALHAELAAALGGRPPTLEELKELPLLDGVVKESMRLLPPVPLSARIVSEPVEVGGHRLEPGTEVGFSHYHTHHDPAIFPNPERFDPWRWATIRPSPYEYMPFSAGLRTCIGMPFALMEIRLVLAMLLQRFRLELPANTRVDPEIGITMAPAGGLPMMIHAQDGRFADGVGGVRGKIRAMVELP